ncbi:hypothetical protein BMS3Abin16_00192 [archaeon BMS3Abin16]|nr:hypothetical protein BMS3Abin16_00192 [archaeon BMS3Abin16]GBE56350.1 hypothetical protein BMS3Bbin16_00554 [archaeon BMS3Bbin16]
MTEKEEHVCTCGGACKQKVVQVEDKTDEKDN